MWPKAYLPILALAFTVALSTSLTSLNRYQIINAKEQPILNAMFCIEAAIMYILYMIVSRILALALTCIEHQQPKNYDYLVQQQEDHDSLLLWDEATAPPPPPASEEPVMSLLYARGLHREALISSMYLGGSGCFLALPALGFWDISITTMLLLSLTCIGLFTENTKHPDFSPNQDKATVILTLRRFRWAIYTALFILQMGILLKDMHQSHYYAYLFSGGNNNNNYTLKNGEDMLHKEKLSPIMLMLAFASPMLLKLALPSTTTNKPSLMSPSQVLEAALPVSCLHAVLVMGWYTTPSMDPPPPIITANKSLPLFIPMLILCPFCQVVILAFILRGFRKKQSLPVVIVLTVTAFIVQQLFHHKLQEVSDMLLLGLTVKVLLLAVGFLVCRSRAFQASPVHPHHYEDQQQQQVTLLNEIQKKEGEEEDTMMSMDEIP